MELGFSTNLLTLGNLKTDLSEAEDEESEFESSNKKKKKNSSFFLEVAQAISILLCFYFL